MAFEKSRLLGFGIENFRIFKNYQWFDFAPITILTGRNNSGKSSLIKALQLFSKSIKLNNGLYLELLESDLKLGSFNEIKHHDNKNSNKITFSFKTSSEIRDIGLPAVEYTFRSKYNEEGINEFELEKNNEMILMIRGKRDGDSFNYTASFINLQEDILNIDKLETSLNHLSKEDFNKIKNEILDFLETEHKMHVSESYWVDYILSQKKHPLFNVVECISDAFGSIGDMREVNVEIDGNYEIPITPNPKFKEILSIDFQKIVGDNFLEEPISKYLNKQNIKMYIPSNLFSPLLEMDVIESVRAEQAVVFKDSENPRLSEAFRNYINLPDREKRESIEIPGYIKSFINGWLWFFGMDEGSELQINHIPAYGYYLLIKKKDGRNMNLTELGYGFTQIIPIILKTCMSQNRIIIIEEPEANLHPALQAKLADFFIRASKDFGIQFIIETHSEYLIRKLQYLTIKTDSDLESNDTVIYYFYPPNEIPFGESQIKKININSDGSLTADFGTGFFDEADKIAMSIWSMNNSQKN